MISRLTNYNSKRDVARLVPGMSLNLNEALRTGVVNDLGTDVSYNGIDSTDAIRGRVSDVFDSIRERNSVVHKEFARISADTNKGVNPSGGGEE